MYIYLSEIGMLDCWPTALCPLTKQAPLRIKAEALFQVKAEGGNQRRIGDQGNDDNLNCALRGPAPGMTQQILGM